jgi:hypothetical protein
MNDTGPVPIHLLGPTKKSMALTPDKAVLNDICLIQIFTVFWGCNCAFRIGPCNSPKKNAIFCGKSDS